MPARQSLGGGKKQSTTPRPKGGAIPSKTPTKVLGGGRQYGPGPVSVYTKPKASPATTQAAVNRWNRQAGQKIVKTTKVRKAADIVVVKGKRGSQKAVSAAFGTPGSWGGRHSGRKGSVVVSSKSAAVARNPADASTRNYSAKLYQHELGHALGLAHPGPPKNPYLSAIGTNPDPSPAQIRRLRRRARESGIMGNGPRANTSEIEHLKAFRAAAKTRARVKKRKTPR